MTRTVKVLKPFCPQKFCNYLVGRYTEPGSSQRCTGVRQETTDKFEKGRKVFSWGCLNLGAGCPSDCGLSTPEILETQHESNFTQLALLWARGWDYMTSQAPSNLCRFLWLHEIILWVHHETDLIGFFLSDSIIIFIWTDLSRSLKTRSFWSMLRIREVPNRVSFILLVLTRTEDILWNPYCQHLSESSL